MYICYNYIGQVVTQPGTSRVNFSFNNMKINTLAAIFCIVFLSFSNSFAQHSLQVDDGNGNYTTILGGNPGGTITLPSGNGVLVLSYLGNSSVAWLNTGNSGTNPAVSASLFNPATNNFLGTIDNKELDFVTNGQVRARFKESTGDTTTSGAFEPGLGVTYSLGTLDRPWKSLVVSPGTITFTASTGVHGNKDHTPGVAAVNIGNLSYDVNTSTFMFDHPLGFTGAGTVTASSVTITGLASIYGGMVKADPSGVLGLADSLTDYSVPLSFSNGLTRTGRNITLGGALGSNVSFTGAGNIAMGGTGTFTVTSLGSGIVKSTAGLLGLATVGTDFQAPMTAGDGITIVANKISLGGSFANDVNINGSSKNFYLINPGDFGIGTASATTGLLEVQCSTKTAFRAFAGGSSGSAGDFSQNNGTNASHTVLISTPGTGNALDATTSGTGWAGHFNGSGASSKGVYVSGGAGQTGLQVNAGSVLLSHTNQAAGAFNLAAGANSVIAISAGAAANYNITLGAGTNGQIEYIFNGEAAGGKTATLVGALHVNNSGPVVINPGNTATIVYVTTSAGSGWVTK